VGRFVIALDQGTNELKSNNNSEVRERLCSVSPAPFTQHYPQPGWVEHDPMEILETELEALADAFEKSGLEPGDIGRGKVGITNQRETTIVWDKETGVPVYNAIVWQCRRTAQICDRRFPPLEWRGM